MKKDYASAVDPWIISMLVGAPLLVLALGCWGYSKSPVAGLIQMGFGVLIAVLIWLFARPCNYCFEADNLRIKCGLLEEAVPYAKIKGGELLRSFESAPGLSTQRVKILLEGGEYRLVSPADRIDFLRELMVRSVQARQTKDSPR